MRSLRLARSHAIITPGSANLEFDEKNKHKQNKKQNKKHVKKTRKIFRLCFDLLRSGLNSSVVWELTTEGGRLSHCGVVRGKMSSSGHRCMSGIYNIGHCVMPWWISNCEQGSGTCFFSTRMYLMKEEQGGPIPSGFKRWPLKLIKHLADTTCISPSPAGPAGCCPLNLFCLVNLKFRVRAPNGCCIL